MNARLKALFATLRKLGAVLPASTRAPRCVFCAKCRVELDVEDRRYRGLSPSARALAMGWARDGDDWLCPKCREEK